MAHTIEIDEELYERLEAHLEEGQSMPEFIEELASIYESTRHMQEGYTE